MAAKTSIKVATLTGAAKDDFFGLSEGDSTYALNVLGNDPGAARLYSVAQEAGFSSSQFSQSHSTILPSGATLAIVDGQLVYSNDSLQSLPAGELHTETFTYTVRMANGALSTASVTLEVIGENDAASIAGERSGELTETGVAASIAGSLSVSDVDRGENQFASVDAQALQGQYGTFSFDSATGAWSYSLDGAAARALKGGEYFVEQLLVTSLDGTASETIEVRINGSDELAEDNGGEPDPQTGFVINHGLSTINGRYVIEGFDANDFLQVANNLQLTGQQTFDYLGDAIQDTLLNFSYGNTSGQGNNSGNLEVVLVGFTDFDASLQIA